MSTQGLDYKILKCEGGRTVLAARSRDGWLHLKTVIVKGDAVPVAHVAVSPAEEEVLTDYMGATCALDSALKQLETPDNAVLAGFLAEHTDGRLTLPVARDLAVHIKRHFVIKG